MTRRILFAGAFALFASLAGATAVAKKPDVTITVATPFPTGHILTDTSFIFKDLIENKTNGRIFVDVRPAFGSEEAVNQATAAGTVDIQLTGGRPVEVFAPEYFFFNGPFVIDDYSHFLRVWDSHLGDEARHLVYVNGNQESLGTVYRGFRQFTSNVPVLGPDDLIGIRLRLPVVPTWITVWSALETQPVAIPLPQLYEALATGIADASEGDLSQISSFRLYEVQSHLALTNHLVGVGWIFANADFMASLGESDRIKVENAMAEAAGLGTARMFDLESSLLDLLETNGMTITQPDAAAIREKAKPAVESLFTTAWPVTTWAEVLSL
jgi:TRAP-type transport system periplasmic protein